MAPPVRTGVTAAMTDRADLDATVVRRALEQEQAELLDVSTSAKEVRQPVELDQQSVGRLSRMDAMQVQAMAQAVEARRRARLQSIEAALQRLESGDFGYCVECGDEISRKRLDIDPTTTRCIDCGR